MLAGDGQRRRRGQHPRSRGLQAGRSRPADAIRRPSAQEPLDLVLRPRRDAGRGGHGRPPLRSDFVGGAYEARIRRNPDRIQVQLVREGNGLRRAGADHQGPDAGRRQSDLEIAYLLENLPADQPLHFAVEFNFAGLPAGADDRYFRDLDGNRLGQLGTRLDLADGWAWGYATSGWGSTWA